MIRRLAVLLAGVAVAVALPEAVSAQTGDGTGARQREAGDLDSQLRRIEARMIPGGWIPLAPSARVDLRGGAAGEYAWVFTAGQRVAAAGACAGMCGEVELSLRDPAGVLLARAYEVADGWALEAEIQEGGEHVLEFSARDCSADPCRVGLVSYVRWPD